MGDRKDREIGMLLGLHSGDALGATLEFSAPRPPASLHRDITGGGVLRWRPGDATDDTDLAICVLDSLARRQSFDAPDLTQRFLEWIAKKPRDVGVTCRVAIARMAAAADPTACGLDEENAQGNGSLMRCAPLALLPIDDAALRDITSRQAALTHAHKNCRDADYLFVLALRKLLGGETREAAFEATLRAAEGTNPPIHAALARIPVVRWSALTTSGFVIDSLCAAFWGLMRTSGFEEAVVQVVNRGDDADTVGALTGALAGAHYGLSAIPERWLSVLRRKEEILSLYDRLPRRTEAAA